MNFVNTIWIWTLWIDSMFTHTISHSSLLSITASCIVCWSNTLVCKRCFLFFLTFLLYCVMVKTAGTDNDNALLSQIVQSHVRMQMGCVHNFPKKQTNKNLFQCFPSGYTDYNHHWQQAPPPTSNQQSVPIQCLSVHPSLQCWVSNSPTSCP